VVVLLDETELEGLPMTFAENLRHQRLQHFLTQGELARRAGVSPVTITRLEAGMTKPSMRTVRALAETLGVEPRDLAEPGEVAEVQRTVGRGKSRDDDRLGAWNDDGGAPAMDVDAQTSTPQPVEASP
jgi:transcriptional regulator with XRE-family HTH domain